MKRRSKKFRGRSKIFIIGGYWILFTALMGIFASPLFKYSANAPSGYTGLNKTIKPSVFVAEKGSETGQKGEHLGIKIDAGKQISGTTGSDGYSNEGEFDLVKKDSSIYLAFEGKIVKNLYFYLTNAKYEKEGKQVIINVFPLTSEDKLANLNPYDDPNIFRLPTVMLYPDKSGGDIVGFTASNGNASTITSNENSSVGVGVPIPVPTPGKEDLNNKEAYSYNEYICALYYWALNIGFGLTLLMFVYAGYRYMTSAGNDSVFTDTKDILTSAILGFLLLLCIRLVLHFLNVPEPDQCFSDASAGKSIVQIYAFNNPKLPPANY